MDKESINYMLNLLRERRKANNDNIVKLEERFNDKVYLYNNPTYKRRLAERELNASIVAELLVEQVKLEVEQQVMAG